MESQLTLVTIAPEVRLLFSADSMKNATLFLDSAPAYMISTDEQNSCTELRTAGTRELLARITRKEVLPDSIMFPNLNGGKEMRLAKWLKKSKLADGSCAIVPITLCSYHCSLGADIFVSPFSSIFGVETEHGTFVLRAHPAHRLAVRLSRLLFTHHS